MKMEAHKSSGIRELITCLCDVFGRRAMACRPVFSRYPSQAVLAAGGRGMALASPDPTMSRALGSPWHRQPQVAPGHGAISLFPPQCSCVCWDHQRAGAPSHPILLVGLSKSSACPQVLCSWDADGPELTHHSCALPGGRNGTTRDVSLEYWMWGESCLFPPSALASGHKRRYLAVLALCS